MPNRKSPRNRRPTIEPLEPRLLFSATADIAVLDDANSDTTYLIQAAANTDLDAIYYTAHDPAGFADTNTLQIDAPQDDTPQEVVFIDTRVDDYPSLLDDILQNKSAEDVAVVLLEPDSDGVGQITEALKNYAGVGAIHIISHGTAGALQLGNTLLNQHSLSQYQEDVTAWGNALGESADLMIYGCNLAGNAEGVQLIEQLAALTQADVAASNDLTGHAQQGGNWQLEINTGNIETAPLFSLNLQQNWQSVLADVNHIHVDDAVNALSFSSSHNVGQSFVYDSSTPTYIVNQLSIQLMKDASAAEQTITVQLLDAWNGTVLGVDTKSSNSLSSTEFEWKTFDFGDLELNDNQTYFIRISSDVDDDLVMVSYHQEDRYNNATLIENGIDNPDSWDLAFKVTDDDGTNAIPIVANPITNQSATEQVAFNYAFPANTFSDSDEGDTLVYTAQLAGGGNLPPWLNFDAANRTFWGMPDNGDVGVITIEVTATDDHGASISDNFDLTIINTNDDPFVANPIADQAATEDVAFNFTFPANAFGEVDPGDQLTYTAQLSGGGALPTWLNFDSATRTFSGTPTASDVGTVAIEVTADDGNGGTPATDTFDLVVYDASFAAATIYETSGASLDTNILSPGQNLYQSFFHTSGNGTYLVDYIALQLRKDPAAQLQNIHVSLLDEITDVTAIAEYTLSSADVETALAWEAFYFNNLTLTDGEEYFIKVSASGSDGLISIGVHNVDMYPNGMFYYDSGTPDASRDLAFQVASAVNNDPVVDNPIPNQNTPEDAPFNFGFDANTFSDIDGDSLTYSATLAGGGALPAWLSFDTATRTFSGTPTNSDVGAVSITVNDDDGQGGLASDTVDIVVDNTNDAPVVSNPIDDQVATEDSAFNFTFPANAFTDPDVGDTLTYSAELTGGGALPAWLSFDATTRTFSGTPTNSDVGTLSITVNADDGQGGLASDTFDIVVDNTNDAPTVANPIDDQVATEDAAFNFAFDANTFNDIDGDSLTYSATLAGGGALPAWLSFDAATRTFSGTPTNGDVGTVSITVDADDGQGGALASDTFDIVVANTNDAPTVANPIDDQAATEDAAFNFVFDANTFNDIDGDSLTYSATLAGGGALPAWLSFDAATRTFSGIPTNSDVGTVSITVNADDSNGGVATETFDLTVITTGDTHYVDTGSGNRETPISSVNQVGQSFLYDSPGATYNVNEISIELAKYAAAVPQTITVEVRDAWNGTVLASASMSSDAISAIGFEWHSFSFTDLALNDNQSYVIRVRTDASDDAVLIRHHDADLFPDGAMIQNGVVDGAGWDLAFKVSQEDGASSAPVVDNPLPDHTVNEDDNFTYTIPANTFSDADVNDTLTYRAQLAGGGSLDWLVFNEITRTFSGIPRNDDIGTLNVEVIATDNHGTSVSEFFTITIVNTNDDPFVRFPLADQAVTENNAFSYTLPNDAFGDDDSDATLTYSAQLVGGGAIPAWLNFDAVTRTFSGTPGAGDVGTLDIEITADDGQGGTAASDNFSLVVYAAPAAADIVYESSPPALTGTGLADAQDAYQSFVEANGNGAYVVDNISVQLRRNADADQTPQTITVSVLDSFNGAVLASNTLSSTELGTALAWYSFDVNNLALTYGQTYFIKVSSTGNNTDPLVYVGIHDTDVYGGGEYHNHNGVPDPSRDLAFEVSGINNAPVVSNPLTDQMATEDIPVNFTIPANTFADPDGDTLTYGAQLMGGGALPAWLSFDAATRTFSGTATHLDTGTLSIEVTATDASGALTSDSFDLTIERVNSAPTTTGVADITRDANSGSDTIDLFEAFADEEDSDAQLIFNVVENSNNALFSNVNIDPVSGSLQLDYAADQSGSSVITLRATDRDGASVETSFTITIVPLNTAPTSSGLENVSATTETPATQINLHDFFDDAEDGTDLQYALMANTNPALADLAALDSSSGTLTLEFSNGSPGETTLTIRATDAQGAWVETTFDVIVSAPLGNSPVEEPVEEEPVVEEPVEQPVEEPIDPPIEPPVEEPVDTPVPINPVPEQPKSPTEEPVIESPPVTPPLNQGGTPIATPGDVIAVDEPINSNDNTDSVLTNNLGQPPVFIAPADIPQGYDEDDRNRPTWTDSRREFDEQQRQAANPYASLTSLIALESGYLNTQELIEFNQEIDRARADMNRVLEEEQQQHAMIAGVTLSITTGILIWSLRASSLLLTLFSMLPLWKGIDPLPILDEVNKRKKELEQQRKDKAKEDRRAGEVGYLFDHDNKES